MDLVVLQLPLVVSFLFVDSVLNVFFSCQVSFKESPQLSAPHSDDSANY